MSASPLDLLKALPQYLLPHHALSRLLRRVTHCRLGAVRRPLIRGFSRLYGIDLAEAESADPDAYPDFNSFFTRALRADTRPVTTASDAIASPVDGTVSQAGDLDNGRVLQAKGRDYGLCELLGGDTEMVRRFEGGRFATLYLSPSDYHRIHMPLTGHLRQMVHVPGRLFSVSPATVRAVPRLFARNERVVTVFDGPDGPFAMVLVGAIFVASIETVWHGEVTPPRGRRISSRDYDGPELARGAEMGRFNMGSTVILLLPPGTGDWGAGLTPGATVRMGEAIGRRTG